MFLREIVWQRAVWQQGGCGESGVKEREKVSERDLERVWGLRSCGSTHATETDGGKKKVEDSKRLWP